VSPFWSAFIISLVVINVAGAAWLMHIYSKRVVTEAQAADEFETHVWDEDLVELNNPLPRWWFLLFWISTAFLVAYLIIYPGFGSFSGVSKWSQVGQYEAEVAAADAKYGAVIAKFAQLPYADIATDPDAMRLGRSLFNNNCTTCHGSDARGAKGFPNLTNADWLYGGSPAAITQSITYGRNGVMPAFGAVLGPEGTNEVLAYTLSLSRQDGVDSQLVDAGGNKFVQFCSACHLPTGTGMQALGAPNLTDDVWLHGDNADDIRDVITNGRSNQMPAQQDQLSEQKIKVLVAYVMGLSTSR
jgi:cytochrome c oxidase cbb3-type subunit 3